MRLRRWSALALAPLLVGWVNQCRAWLANKRAPSILLPYRTIHKLFVKDAVKVAAHKDAPYPAGLKAAANSNTAAPAETPAEDVQAPEATEGQEG